MDDLISYTVIQRVLTSWELARQSYSSPEEIGTQALLCLFRNKPETKQLFGFSPKQNVEGNPMLKHGAMIHGTHMYSMLNQVLNLVGPDMESLVDYLDTLGVRHSRRGVKVCYFAYFCDSVREVLATVLGEKYCPEDDAAWKELLEFLTATISKNMK